MNYTIPVYKISLIKESEGTATKTCNSRDVVLLIREYLRDSILERESFVCIALNTKNVPIAMNTVSIGTLQESLVHPREIFKFAILANAAAIIIAHNHPSGDPEPSAADRKVTKQVEEAGKLLLIPLLDHVIVGETTWYSFKDSGQL